MFPFTSLSFTTRSPTSPDQETTITLEDAELQVALQYSETDGLKPLVDWLYGLQELNHDRKTGEGWRITPGCGSQDLIYKAVQCMVNPGDAVLVESPVYGGVIPMFASLHCEQIEVETDAHGIRSSSLRKILEGWAKGKPKPKVLYTVPPQYGCNPTGMTATTDRRKEVIELAREHNFIILEDDPYFYVYYGEAPRHPSYFQLELEEPEVGRVVRFDSVSKILSAGIRIGFASGPTVILNAIDQLTSTSNLQVPSLTQVMIYRLLSSWGYDGFAAHVKRVAEFYKAKRDVFERGMRKHLTGLAEWDSPEAGMFFWFKLLLTDDADLSHQGDSEDVIRTRAFENGVLAVPGTAFIPNGGKTPYVRASFSLIGEDEIDTALQRIRDAILQERAARKAAVV
ncbi:hypothetical protein NLJ89_g2365 [Agrocybe chaxingu]|uniref:Aminotransferase class I/classII large domain-containing protein n=1 Tax=Agrocybe chaxingu TaxID=84603 RepID=A0A9W8MYR3_9AGAR|nr:hypothetical protein NLJ89_g2365 [Agrocybe chaxingu]